MSATQLPLDLPHRAAMGADDFLVAPSNEAAVAWLDAWPNWPSPALVLHGPAGCGKTHLSQVWQARNGAIALRPDMLQPDTLADLLGEHTAVIVDDVDQVAGHQAQEQALFHLYNMLRDRSGHLLLLSCTIPAQWGIRLPDLRSRVLGAAAVAVAPPDDALLNAVFVKLFADRQLKIGENVIEFLLRRTERSFDAARQIVAALDQEALASRRPITVPFAREVLVRLFPAEA